MSDPAVKLDVANRTRTQCRIRLTLGETIVYADDVSIFKDKDRARFINQAIQAVPGLEGREGELRHALLQLTRPPAPSDAIAGPEWDISRIIRPELFLTSDVVGLSVPAFAIVEGRPMGKWSTYLRWADGRRECRERANGIDLPGGKPLWIHPEPAPPSPDMQPPWSHASRQEWLAGIAVPDAAAAFKTLCEAFAYFLDLPAKVAEGTTATLALWTMLSYVFQAWDAVPYLYIGGPLGSGKSRVFELLERTSARALSSSNMSASALFRRLNDRGGTLLLDEAERLKETTPDASELRSILLAGYKRGGKAIRNEPLGDGRFQQVEFDVFGPKAVACITGLPPALSSRCIPINMFRCAPGSDKPKRRLDADPRRWVDLRDALHIFTLEYGALILEVAKRTHVCPPMSGRNYELWQPLLAMASWLDDIGVRGLLSLMREHALQVTEGAQEDQTPDSDETLLRVLAEMIGDLRTPTPSEVLAKAKELDGETFKKWGARGVSNLLRRYGLTTKKSNGQRVYNSVTESDLRRIQQNYNIDLGFVLETTPLGCAPIDPCAPDKGDRGARGAATKGIPHTEKVEA